MDRCDCCEAWEPLPYEDRHGYQTCIACHDGLCSAPNDPDGDECRKDEALTKYADLATRHAMARVEVTDPALDKDTEAAIRSITGKELMQ